MSELVGDPAYRGCGARMRLLAERHVRDRVALETVRTALEQDELRPGCTQVLLDARPRADEIRVGRAGQQRQVELGADGRAGTGFAGRAGSGEQVTAVLVYVRE